MAKQGLELVAARDQTPSALIVPDVADTKIQEIEREILRQRDRAATRNRSARDRVRHANHRGRSLFERLQSDAWTVHVGPGPTRASYVVSDFEGLRQVLKLFAESGNARKAS
jgi:hypothetical protein